MIGTLPSIRFHSKITAISGNKITLERPLRLNVRTKWSPRILTVSGQVSGVGIEGFTMEFPDVPYKGHFKEDGYNGIFLFGSWNCWVRDITLHNCESGVFLEKSAFCTVDKAASPQPPPTGITRGRRRNRNGSTQGITASNRATAMTI